MASVLNPAAITARKRAQISRIRSATGLAVSRIWNAMPNHSADTQSAFAKQALPVIRAGQDKAISLQLAQLKLVTGIDPKISRSDLLDKVAPDLTTPFLAFGKALSDGQDILDALELGASTAQTVAEDGVQWAARSSGTAIDHSDQVAGWERIPDGNACDWCLMVADQTYSTADGASFGHAGCGCDIQPVMAGST